MSILLPLTIREPFQPLLGSGENILATNSGGPMAVVHMWGKGRPRFRSIFSTKKRQKEFIFQVGAPPTVMFLIISTYIIYIISRALIFRRGIFRRQKKC